MRTVPAAVVALVAWTGCLSEVRVVAPELPAGTQTVLFVLEGSWDVVGADRGAAVVAVGADGVGHLSFAGDARGTLTALAFPYSLEELQLAPGLVVVGPQVACREQPRADAAFATPFGTGEPVRWAPAERVPEVCLPAFDLDACFAASGCVRADPARCEQPCAEGEVTAPIAPATPDLPSPPELACPPGWSEVVLPDVPGWCAPPPEELCPEGQAQLGPAPCAPIGAACPTGQWPDLTAAQRVVYVDPLATPPGNGTLAAPFTRIADALAGARGSTIALARGDHVSPEVIALEDAVLAGACAAETVLHAPAGLHVADARVMLRELTIETGAGSVAAGAGAELVLANVIVDGTASSTAASAFAGGSLTMRSVLVRAAGTGVAVRRGSVHLDRVTVQSDDLGVDVFESSAVVERSAVRTRIHGFSVHASELEVRASTIEGAQTAAIDAASSTVSLDTVVLRSRFLVDHGAATLTGTETASVLTYTASVIAHDVVVRGLMSVTRGALELDRAVVSGGGHGVSLTDARAQVRNLHAHDTSGGCLTASGGALSLERARLEECSSGALQLRDVAAEVADVSVTSEEGDPELPGVWVSSGTTSVQRMAVTGWPRSLVMRGPGVVEDLTFDPGATWGFTMDLNGPERIERVSIARTGGVAILVGRAALEEPGALVGLVIRDVEVRGCGHSALRAFATDLVLARARFESCSAVGLLTDKFSMLEATDVIATGIEDKAFDLDGGGSVDRFRAEGAARGMVLRDPALQARNGAIADCGIGAQLAPEITPTRALIGVRFGGNTTNLVISSDQ